jgi:hypothetical protein
MPQADSAKHMFRRGSPIPMPGDRRWPPQRTYCRERIGMRHAIIIGDIHDMSKVTLSLHGNN